MLLKRWHLEGSPWPVEASAPVGAAVPWGYVPPFGTTSCLYEGPWHIHVPLGPYHQGTASFVGLEVAASFGKQGAAGTENFARQRVEGTLIAALAAGRRIVRIRRHVVAFSEVR